VLVGSPGSGAESATALGVVGEHVWVGATSSDPITHLSWFGTDPAARSFGARRFPAEPPPTADHSGLAAHSDYLLPGAPALGAVARIVAGDGRDVAHAPGRTDHGIAAVLLTAVTLPPLLSLGWVPAPPDFGDPAADR